MAKEVKGTLKLQILAGQANPLLRSARLSVRLA